MQWEYASVFLFERNSVPFKLGGSIKGIETDLERKSIPQIFTEIGSYGWELVTCYQAEVKPAGGEDCVRTVFFFKRPKG